MIKFFFFGNLALVGKLAQKGKGKGDVKGGKFKGKFDGKSE